MLTENKRRSEIVNRKIWTKTSGIKIMASLNSEWSKYKHETSEFSHRWCTYWPMWTIKQLYIVILFAYLILENLDGKNLKTKPIYSVPYAECGLKSCRVRLRKICESGRRHEQFMLLKFWARRSWRAPQLHGERYAMSSTWGTWLARGSCSFDERHKLKMFFFDFFHADVSFSPLLTNFCFTFSCANSYLENIYNTNKIPT